MNITWDQQLLTLLGGIAALLVLSSGIALCWNVGCRRRKGSSWWRT